MKEQDLIEKLFQSFYKELKEDAGFYDEETSKVCVQIAKDYAGQEAIEFAEWLHQNRWFSFQNGYWYYTFENPTAISNESYNKKYRKTTSELYQLFKNIENER